MFPHRISAIEPEITRVIVPGAEEWLNAIQVMVEASAERAHYRTGLESADLLVVDRAHAGPIEIVRQMIRRQAIRE